MCPGGAAQILNFDQKPTFTLMYAILALFVQHANFSHQTLTYLKWSIDEPIHFQKLRAESNICYEHISKEVVRVTPPFHQRKCHVRFSTLQEMKTGARNLGHVRDACNIRQK